MIKDITLTRGLDPVKLKERKVELSHDVIKCGPLYYAAVLIGPLDSAEDAHRAGQNSLHMVMRGVISEGGPPDTVEVHLVELPK